MRAFTVLAVFAVCLAAAAWANLDDGQDDLWWAEKYQRRLKRMIEAETKLADENLRLPQDLVPVSYVIALIPLIEVGKFTTDGTIEIVINCVNTTQSIVLNAAELQIEQTSIQVKVQIQIKIESYFNRLLGCQVIDMATNIPLNVGMIKDEQSTREMITIPVVPFPLEKGKKYKLSMRFVSVLNDKLRGLYRSSYVENGQTK